MNVVIKALDADTLADFLSMHDLPECRGCYCMYWQFSGDNRAWQGAAPEEKREEKSTLVREGKSHGLLAYEGGAVVGTLQLEARASLPKLTQRMPYRDLGAQEGVWSIGCVLVRESHRRRGIAKALVLGAIEALSARDGATALEGYPRRADDLRDDELWMGPEGIYQALGFTLARDHMQYPVYRRAITHDPQAEQRRT